MKRIVAGMAAGIVMTIAGGYLVQVYWLHKIRLQMALQGQAEQDFRRALPDAGRAVVGIVAEGGNVFVSKDGDHGVEITCLRGCQFKEIQVRYQSKRGKVQPQSDRNIQQLDAAARPVHKKGCASGTVVSQ